MKPGRELDALVAEKVMGLSVKRELINDGSGAFFYPELLAYSTGIAAAWEVVEKVKSWETNHDEDGYKYTLEFYFYFSGGKWNAGFVKSTADEISLCGDNEIDIQTSSAPLSICLAALKACGVEI